jgi:hypothetical protein
MKGRVRRVIADCAGCKAYTCAASVSETEQSTASKQTSYGAHTNQNTGTTDNEMQMYHGSKRACVAAYLVAAHAPDVVLAVARVDA